MQASLWIAAYAVHVAAQSTGARYNEPRRTDLPAGALESVPAAIQSRIR